MQYIRSYVVFSLLMLCACNVIGIARCTTVTKHDRSSLKQQGNRVETPLASYTMYQKPDRTFEVLPYYFPDNPHRLVAEIFFMGRAPSAHGLDFDGAIVIAFRDNELSAKQRLDGQDAIRWMQDNKHRIDVMPSIFDVDDPRDVPDRQTPNKTSFSFLSNLQLACSLVALAVLVLGLILTHARHRRAGGTTSISN